MPGLAEKEKATAIVWLGASVALMASALTAGALMAGLALSPAHAAEGMWLPAQIPALAPQLKDAGLALPATSLARPDKAPLGAIVSLGNCSASFVSPMGLVITNHHCVLQSLQANSTPAHNYVRDGFLAKTPADEIPAAPGSRIYVLQKVADVTPAILAGTEKLTGAERAARLETNEKHFLRICEAAVGVRCNVQPIYEGARYILQQMLEIKDVRLVHAPAEAIGFYGGDEDNWVWPRQTGDYSFYRAYVAPDGTPRAYAPDNIPYRPQHYLRPAAGDLKDGDYVMILGFPGTTMRRSSAADAKAWFEDLYPLQRRLLAAYSDIIRREAQSESDQLAYASLKAGADNYVKKIGGQLEAARSSHLLQRKEEEDARLRRWAGRLENRAHAKALAAFARIRAAEWRDTDARLLNQTLDRAQLLMAAQLAYRWAKERARPDAERTPGFQDRDRETVEDRLRLVGRQYVPHIDRAALGWAIGEVEKLPSAKRNEPLLRALHQIGMEALYSETQLADSATLLHWLDEPAAAFEKATDPFIRVAVAGYAFSESRRVAERHFNGNRSRASGPWLKALEAYAAAEGTPLYPDASRQLRFTFGHVTGAPASDGVRWAPFTTPAGLLQKETGEAPYDSPPRLLSEIGKKDWGRFASPALGTLPVNFLSDTDITNGNSGSAVLNAKGELVGLAFDGTLQGMLSDWQYDPATTRTIAVDLRYVLWLMDKVTDAHNLLAEMGVPPGDPSSSGGGPGAPAAATAGR